MMATLFWDSLTVILIILEGHSGDHKLIKSSIEKIEVFVGEEVFKIT